MGSNQMKGKHLRADVEKRAAPEVPILVIRHTRELNGPPEVPILVFWAPFDTRGSWSIAPGLRCIASGVVCQ